MNIGNEKNVTSRLRFTDSIQARLLFLVVVLTIIPLIALQIYSLMQTIQVTKSEIITRFAQIGGDETNFIMQWAEERLADARTIASMEEIKSFDAENGIPLTIKYRDLWGGLEALALVDNEGITSINSTQSTIDVHDRAYFTEAITGKEVISDPVVSRASGSVIVVYAVPVTQFGKTVGVLIENVPITTITELLAQINLGTTGEAYLIKQDGTMITTPKYENILLEQGLVEETAVLNFKMDTYASQQIAAGSVARKNT